MSQPGDIQFANELETLRAQAGKLRQAGADILVAVAHADRQMDLAIVRSRLVDVLLTGHDHDLAIVFDGKTVMVESNEEGNFVTAIDFTVQATGEGKDRKVSWSPSFRVHDSSTVDPDPEVGAAVKKLEDALSKELDVTVGTSVGELDSRSAIVRSQEAAIGNLIADAVKASTGADVAIVNGGGIRANKQYPAGVTLTRRDILSELPFGNATSMVEVSGAEIRAALENGVSQLENRAGRFPQVSGLKFEVDSKSPVGSRIVAVSVNGQPLDPAGKYKVATNNFMLAGGDGYVAFGKGKVLIGDTDGKLLANEVMSYVRAKGSVDAKVEGRIVIR
jgi:2',3'-cyclic-nucleotide 2'-phosphodiesterase (5'-nucleotidase family)